MPTKPKRNRPGTTVPPPTESATQSDIIVMRQAFETLATQFIRTGAVGGLGNQFGTKRNIYEACGYPSHTAGIAFETYNEMYQREDLASRVIDAYPDATWKAKPIVMEREDPDGTPTAFDKALEELLDRVDLWHYIHRLDKLSGVGQYGCMLLGLSDGVTLDLPADTSSPRDLLYLRPLDEGMSAVKAWETVPTVERYGLPTAYSVDIPFGDNETARSQEVHYTRIFHVADGQTTSDVYGVPRLQRVFNRLMDLQKVVGGGAEMFWQGGFPGMSFEAEDGAVLPDAEGMKDEIQKFIHGLQRYLTLRGVKANQFETQVANPEHHLDMILKLISGASRIPVRILVGSERGELASTQDRDNWQDRVEERRETYVEPVLVMGMLDRLIEVGALPAYSEKPRVTWPDKDNQTPKEKAEIGAAIARAVAEYVKTPGLEMMVPPQAFLRDVLGFEGDMVEAWEEEARRLMQEEGLEGGVPGISQDPETPEEIDRKERMAEGQIAGMNQPPVAPPNRKVRGVGV